jgi:hypothetical protein
MVLTRVGKVRKAIENEIGRMEYSCWPFYSVEHLQYEDVDDVRLLAIVPKELSSSHREELQAILEDAVFRMSLLMLKRKPA